MRTLEMAGACSHDPQGKHSNVGSRNLVVERATLRVQEQIVRMEPEYDRCVIRSCYVSGALAVSVLCTSRLPVLQGFCDAQSSWSNQIHFSRLPRQRTRI